MHNLVPHVSIGFGNIRLSALVATNTLKRIRTATPDLQPEEPNHLQVVLWQPTPLQIIEREGSERPREGPIRPLPFQALTITGNRSPSSMDTLRMFPKPSISSQRRSRVAGKSISSANLYIYNVSILRHEHRACTSTDHRPSEFRAERATPRLIRRRWSTGALQR